MEKEYKKIDTNNVNLGVIIGGILHDSVALHNNARMGKGMDKKLIVMYAKELLDIRDDLIKHCKGINNK